MSSEPELPDVSMEDEEPDLILVPAVPIPLLTLASSSSSSSDSSFDQFLPEDDLPIG